MIVNKIILKNFRSYEYLDVSLTKGLNVIVGPNGSGKTNLAEAIYYLSLGKSFRTSNDKEAIATGAETAQIEANTTLGQAKNKIKIILSKETKTVLINSKKIKKLSTLSNLANVIVFKPSDVEMFKDSPSVRRKFLDVAISKQNDIYLENLAMYQKILKERNELLKEENIDKIHLEVLDEQLSKVALSISRERLRYINSINKVLNKVISAISTKKSSLYVTYHPFIELDQVDKQQVMNYYNSYLQTDIKNKSTTVGPHREDFEVYYEDKNIAKYGSQGENRLAAIALILTPYFLISDEDLKPVVILDDVLSELDDIHQRKLIKLISKLNQTIITTTQYDYECSSMYEIKNNKIIRRVP